MIDAGAHVIPFEAALTHEGKLHPGIVVIEQGESADADLAINRVRNLRETCLVRLYERPCPAEEHSAPQEKLDSIIKLLAWDFTHLPIFVNDGSWAFASMNGAVVNCGSTSNITEAVSELLVPKLAAPIRPPNPRDILYREGALDINSPWYQQCVGDFVEAAAICRENGMMLAHTRLDALRFRNPFLKRLASAYLDERTGMSYGFLAKQLPCPIIPATPISDSSIPVENNEGVLTKISIGGKWAVTLPVISVLLTRSGCDKANISPDRDLVLMTLQDGKITLDTAPGVRPTDARPSYDTLVILSHAIGNAIGASVLSATEPTSAFVKTLMEAGLSMLHWHGYPPQGESPLAYAVHGEDNPPVSCSTPQSAIFAILGKLSAIDSVISRKEPYRGDVHIEPHHGTNLVGILSLTQAARWVDQHCQSEIPIDGQHIMTGGT